MDGGQPGFGIARVLRPYVDFAADYEGQASTTPIMFTEGGEPLDPQAGEPGYASNLLRGLIVPVGARVLIWLPAINGGAFVQTPYLWHVSWRLRNTFDYRQTRQPFHLAKQGEGVPDTTVPVGQQARVVIPAAYQVLLFNPTPPAAVADPAVVSLREEQAEPHGPNYPLPLLPGGVLTGTFQQGLLDPTSAPATAPAPLFVPYEIPVLGDELLIGATRPISGGNTWAFATEDNIFSRMFGDGAGTTFPDIGVYVMIGKKS